MSPYRSNLPAWLNNAYTESHIGLVIRTLTERESQREKLRSMSWRQAQSSSASSDSSPESSPTNSLYGHIPQAHCNHYSIIAASNERNAHHNRYRDVVPYDRTRVIVESGNRYLNASWVLERCGHKWWIATQAPLPTTTHTFLSLVMQPIARPPNTLSVPPTSHEGVEVTVPSYGTSRIRTVVQLTKNVEMGRTKAHTYFPTEVGTSIIVPPDRGLTAPALKVTLLQTHNHEDAQCIQSTVAIGPVDLATKAQGSAQNTNGDGVQEHDKQFVFQHLMYIAWPDHGVPEDKDRASLLAFLKLVDRINRDASLCNYPPTPLPAAQKQYDPDPPIIVGCSAGIGRTGSFIALSSLLRQNGFLLPALNPTSSSVIPPSPLGALPVTLAGDLVVEEIDSLREQRPRMVERPEQILLVYELLIGAFQNT